MKLCVEFSGPLNIYISRAGLDPDVKVTSSPTWKSTLKGPDLGIFVYFITSRHKLGRMSRHGVDTDRQSHASSPRLIAGNDENKQPFDKIASSLVLKGASSWDSNDDEQQSDQPVKAQLFSNASTIASAEKSIGGDTEKDNNSDNYSTDKDNNSDNYNTNRGETEFDSGSVHQGHISRNQNENEYNIHRRLSSAQPSSLEDIDNEIAEHAASFARNEGLQGKETTSYHDDENYYGQNSDEYTEDNDPPQSTDEYAGTEDHEQTSGDDYAAEQTPSPTPNARRKSYTTYNLNDNDVGTPSGNEYPEYSSNDQNSDVYSEENQEQERQYQIPSPASKEVPEIPIEGPSKNQFQSDYSEEFDDDESTMMVSTAPSASNRVHRSYSRDFNTPSPDHVKVDGVLEFHNKPLASVLGAREESETIEKLQRQVFDLQLRITQMEEQWHWTGDVGDLQHKLLDSELARKKLVKENKELNDRISALLSERHSQQPPSQQSEQSQVMSYDELLNRNHQLEDENQAIRKQMVTIHTEIGQYDELRQDYTELEEQRNILEFDVDYLVKSKQSLQEELAQLALKVDEATTGAVEALPDSAIDLDNLKRLRDQNRQLLGSIDASKTRSKSQAKAAEVQSHVIEILSQVVDSVGLDAGAAYQYGSGFQQVFDGLVNIIENFMDQILNENQEWRHRSDDIDLSRLQRDLTDAQRAIETGHTALKMLEAKYKRESEKWDGDCQLLKSILKIVQDKYDNNTTLKTLTGQLSAAFNVVEDVQKVSDEFREELKKSQDEQEKVIRKSSRLENEISSLKGEIASLKTQRDELQAKLNAGAAETAKIQSTSAQQSTEFQAKLNSILGEKSGIERELRSATNQLKALDKDIISKDQQIAALSHNLAEIMATQRQSDHQAEALADRVNVLSRKLEHSKVHVDQILQMIGEIFDTVFGVKWTRTFMTQLKKLPPLSNEVEFSQLGSTAVQSFHEIVTAAVDKQRHICNEKCPTASETLAWKSRFEDMADRYKLEVERRKMNQTSFNNRVLEQDLHLRKLTQHGNMPVSR